MGVMSPYLAASTSLLLLALARIFFRELARGRGLAGAGETAAWWARAFFWTCLVLVGIDVVLGAVRGSP